MRSTDPDTRSTRSRTPARLAALRAVVGARLRSERGSVLIEVMVGAVVLAIASVAILNGIDGAQRTGAANKARTVEATVAEQDIERMRSLPLAALNGLNQTRLVNVAGVNYTVVSRTEWISDSAGAVNCNDPRAQADYLKLTSTVTAPATPNHSVTETALLTPGVGQLSGSLGTATVALIDREGLPLPGVGVSLSGASSQSATTNSLGCAVFGYIPAGSYTITVTGYTTPISDAPATDEMQVYIGRGSFNALQVARPTTLRANFVAPTGHTNTTSMIWDTITVKNGALPSGKKTYTRTTKATSVDAPELYPYLDGVGVYAGACPANDPSTYDPDYFVPTAPRGFAPVLVPGEVVPPRNVSVEMPALRVRVTRQPNTTTIPSWTRTQLKITSLDTGCTAVAYDSGNVDRTSNLQSTVTFNVALPFGNYRICAAVRGRISGTSGTTGQGPVERRYVTTTAAGTNPANPADQALTYPPPLNRDILITIPTSGATGMCP